MTDRVDAVYETPLLRQRLRPHRSLNRGQVRVLLACVAVAGLLTSLPFFLIGAWPVVGFMGLDVLAVWIAFRASFRSARAYEDVVLTVLELLVAKVSARGERAEWRFNPAWVRLARDHHEEFGLQRLAVVSRGRELEIGGFLGPDQKAEFADQLAAGLARARRGVQWS